jgi:hypothetical protein
MGNCYSLLCEDSIGQTHSAFKSISSSSNDSQECLSPFIKSCKTVTSFYYECDFNIIKEHIIEDGSEPFPESIMLKFDIGVKVNL